MDNHKKSYGQFFTTNALILQEMIGLMNIHENMSILEPSAGQGDIVHNIIKKHPKLLNNIEAWEIDETITPINKELPISYGENFFDKAFEYIQKNKQFNTIIGNPPYNVLKNAHEKTKENAQYFKEKFKYPDKVNLYILFIHISIHLLAYNGELIFIVPREWLYLNSAKPLHKAIMENGHITHIIDIQDSRVFNDTTISNLIIFRFEKNKKSQVLFYKELTNNITNNTWQEKRILNYHNSFLILDNRLFNLLHKNDYSIINDIFDIKVGSATGADTIYNVTHHDELDTFLKESTVHKTLTTRGIEYFINVNDYKTLESIPKNTMKYLLEHKDLLINRRIRTFDESNWWLYGAQRNEKYMYSTKPRLMMTYRTRKKELFTIGIPGIPYIGSMSGAYPKKKMNLTELKDYQDYLNSDLFKDFLKAFGLQSGSRVILQPSAFSFLPIFKNSTIKKILSNKE